MAAILAFVEVEFASHEFVMFGHIQIASANGLENSILCKNFV